MGGGIAQIAAVLRGISLIDLLARSLQSKNQEPESSSFQTTKRHSHKRWAEKMAFPVPLIFPNAPMPGEKYATGLWCGGFSFRSDPIGTSLVSP